MFKILKLYRPTVKRLLFVIGFIRILCNISNQKILNVFGIFNSWKCHTQKYFTSFSGKVYFPSFQLSLIFFVVRKCPLCFPSAMYLLIGIWKFLICLNIPNFVECRISILWSYILLNNVSISHPETIIFLLGSFSCVSINQFLN